MLENHFSILYFNKKFSFSLVYSVSKQQKIIIF